MSILKEGICTSIYLKHQKCWQKLCETVNLHCIRSCIVQKCSAKHAHKQFFRLPSFRHPRPKPLHFDLIFYTVYIKLFTFERFQFQVHLVLRNIKIISPYFVLFPNSSDDF
jgi:hypothetical protein